ncbi:phosphate ABC transporter permease PstA [Leptolyngbya sp. 'hensonii']|uniref:phosphate ABC transporter permease PstA n=1 Tax=Leptolyngbya sp. 'hensonii' TaxID=1922337 RepID=UPI00209B8AB7|nr:phosphate ABC transporter permease PstA [Leptolyngbya sp. 'hensonii']
MDTIQTSIFRRRIISNLFAGFGFLIILFSLATLLMLVAYLLYQGYPRLINAESGFSFNWKFFTSFPSRFPEEAGIYAAWVGSALIMLVTSAFAIPMGVAAGIYLEEYARKNWLADLIEINVTNLAGVPSIIYGLLALGLFARQFHLGQSIITAGLTLGLLILPVVIVTTRESLRAVPDSLREAAYALGASRWQMIWDHILPYSIGGILTGVIIGLSRAIGETAPLITIGALTFIAFLPPTPLKVDPTFPFFQVSFEWLMAPFTVMPIQMFNWVSRPQPEFQINAAAAGAVLVFMTLSMNTIAILLRYFLRRGIKW